MKITVLLSGGVDSSTCLALAAAERGAAAVEALCVRYGQKHEREVASARAVAARLGVRFAELDLTAVFAGAKGALMKGSPEAVDHRSYAEQLKDLGGAGTVGTYVPFRNGIMLAAAAAAAQINGSEEVWYGAHRDDAAGRAYPDCTEEFVRHMGAAIYEGTGRGIRLRAPFIAMNKAEIVAAGLRLKVPYELTWSCYEGGDRPCGTCGTCIDRRRAFELNGARDPLLPD